MKIAVIGGVISTSILLEKLFEHNFKLVKVFAYNPKKLSNVSAWEDLSFKAKEFGYDNDKFTKIVECEDSLNKYKPDYIFVVGLSQIIPESILKIPRNGCIGFHPTALPRGRGRAPLAWLIIEEEEGAATFFWLGSGVDEGSIIEQISFKVTNKDNASSITKKMIEAERCALDLLLARIKKSNLKSIKQDFKKATWFGKRIPEDGLINWSNSAIEIDKLIRASTSPHPGAFTFYEQKIIKIWDAEEVSKLIKGVTGRILEINAKTLSFTIQTGNGLLLITKWSANDWYPKVGMSLGYISQIEINKLHKEVIELRNIIKNMEKKILNLEEQVKNMN
tara:strand:+ start:26 stop:1030 length:1005 start_codon:yes stop_codon:yes gene_type:complete